MIIKIKQKENKIMKILLVLSLQCSLILSLIGCVNIKDFHIMDTWNQIVKSHVILDSANMESTPFVWQGKLLYLISNRVTTGDLSIVDFETNTVIVSFAQDYFFSSAMVYNNTLYITAMKDNTIWIMSTTDLINFSTPIKVVSFTNCYNSSLCYNPDSNKFILVYEVDKPRSFSIRFMESTDLINWTETGSFDIGTYSACPTIRYINGYYYLWYLFISGGEPGNVNPWYVTNITRSTDLINWQYSYTDFLSPDSQEQNNTSDMDLCEFNGKVYILYSIGNQTTWASVTYAIFTGTLQELVNHYFL
jgi:alpha-L-fucosidase